MWSGWVGIAQMTGFGRVSPLPGIWPSLHLDTVITLPVGVEAYAGFALRAWLASEHTVSARTRRFAKWSAIFSFALGMAGQVAYHLLAQADAARAPWPITTIVSCLPVLVLAMGTTLAHMLHADAAAGTQDSQDVGPATAWSPDQPIGDQRRPDQVQGHGPDNTSSPLAVLGKSPLADPGGGAWNMMAPEGRNAERQIDQARLIARKLAAAGKPVSRRALRSASVRGSNESLNALARKINAELANERDDHLLTAGAGQRG